MFQGLSICEGEGEIYPLEGKTTCGVVGEEDKTWMLGERLAAGGYKKEKTAILGRWMPRRGWQPWWTKMRASTSVAGLCVKKWW